jgi:FkbM family methyltransferase
MQVWRQALRGGGLFLDVGANVGAYTIWAAECGAEVIALEPAADTFGCCWRTSRSTVTG